MTEEYLYHYKKSRKKRSSLFIRMGVVSLGYIGVLYVAEHFFNVNVPKNIHNIVVVVFSIAAIVMFLVARWYIKNPAIYEASITSDVLSVSYPESEYISFKVNVENIERIEQRQTHGGGGKSILKVGVLMKNSEFHEISMNYGNSVNKMFKILKSIKADITFPKTVKTDYYLFGKKRG